MFRIISWGQYFTTILVLVIIYYLVIAVRYYRHELMKMLQLKNKAAGGDNFITEKATGEQQFNNAEKLKIVLQHLFEQAAEKRWLKEELQMGLHSALQNFSGFKGTAFQVAINNHIAGESKSRCKVEFSEAELQQLW